MGEGAIHGVHAHRVLDQGSQLWQRKRSGQVVGVRVSFREGLQAKSIGSKASKVDGVEGWELLKEGLPEGKRRFFGGPAGGGGKDKVGLSGAPRGHRLPGGLRREEPR